MRNKQRPLEMIPGINIATEYRSQEDVVLDIEHHNLIDIALGTIKNPRNAEIFKKYWYEGYILRELGEEYHIGCERVRQILIYVMKRIR